MTKIQLVDSKLLVDSEVIDYMMLLYLQGVILHMLFVQSSIQKNIIKDILLKFLSLIKGLTLLIDLAY